MRLKVLGYSAIAFILLIAGYQKYSEYQFLRSIKNYDECVAAKGSIIQESHPATCITKLDTRFAEPTPIVTIAQIPSDWKMIELSSWSFLIPPSWHISNCQEKYFIVDSLSKINDNNCPLNGDLFITRQSRSQLSEPAYKKYLNVPNIKAITEKIMIGGQQATRQVLHLPGGMIEGPTLYIEFDEYIDTIKYDNSNEVIITKILSTFKFLEAEPTL